MRNGITATILALLAIAAYVTFRFEWQFGVAALVATFHDVFVTLGLFVILQLEFDLTAVAALLTLAGYSINDTVVIFDRVKDNAHTLGQPGRRTILELVNTSLNEVLYRSLNTTISSLLPVGALLFIGARLLGATTLQDLALALFIGLLVGAYSSIFVAGPLYAHWKASEPAERRRIAKAAARAEGSDPSALAAIDASYEGRAPITTDYVRGDGRRGRRRR
jgi:preprotein translocase subunit SecF